jgi:hypothetical protein
MQLVIMKGFQFEGDDYVPGQKVDIEPVKALRILHNFSGHVGVRMDGPVAIIPVEVILDTEWPAETMKPVAAKRARTRKAR